MSAASAFPARHAVILAHPSPTSFNALVARTYCRTVERRGGTTILRDLYALGFNPLLSEHEAQHRGAVAPDVAQELAILQDADVIVLVYPVWFGAPPAMLKGYLDRVLGHGVTAQGLQAGEGSASLKGKRLVSVTTSAASKFWLERRHQLDAMQTLFGDYLVSAFGLAGHDSLHLGEMAEGLAQEYIDPLIGQVEHLAERMSATEPALPC